MGVEEASAADKAEIFPKGAISESKMRWHAGLLLALRECMVLYSSTSLVSNTLCLGFRFLDLVKFYCSCGYEVTYIKAIPRRHSSSIFLLTE